MNITTTLAHVPAEPDEMGELVWCVCRHGRTHAAVDNSQHVFLATHAVKGHFTYAFIRSDLSDMRMYAY